MPRSRFRDAMASEPPWPARVFPLVSEKPESVHVFSLDGSSKIRRVAASLSWFVFGTCRYVGDATTDQRFFGSFLEFARLKAMTTSRSCTESE